MPQHFSTLHDLSFTNEAQCLVLVATECQTFLSLSLFLSQMDLIDIRLFCVRPHLLTHTHTHQVARRLAIMEVDLERTEDRAEAAEA